jgi:hypothetical protein
VTLNDVHCNCNLPWNAVIPKPPCPVHGGMVYDCGPYRDLISPVYNYHVSVLDDSYGDLTEEFFGTLGIRPGYVGKEKKRRKVALAEFLENWTDACSLVPSTGDGVPVVASVQRVLYPGGEENVIAFSGTRNPLFAPDAELWRVGVTTVVSIMKGWREQTTAQISFRPVRLRYLRD